MKLPPKPGESLAEALRAAAVEWGAELKRRTYGWDVHEPCAYVAALDFGGVLVLGSGSPFALEMWTMAKRMRGCPARIPWPGPFEDRDSWLMKRALAEKLRLAGTAVFENCPVQGSHINFQNTARQELSAWLERRWIQPRLAELALSLPKTPRSEGEEQISGVLECAWEKNLENKQRADQADHELLRRIQAREPGYTPSELATTAFL